jgi:apolipoprotein N-acyltransferase
MKAPHHRKAGNGRTKVVARADRRRERLNLALEKAAWSLAGGILLALPFVTPSLAPLHFAALVPWIILTLHPRYRARAAWVLPGSYVFLMMSMRPFTILHVLAPVTLAFICFIPFMMFPFFLRLIEERIDLPLAIAVPLAWTPMEWLRVRMNFNQLQLYYLGSSQYRWTDLIQVADFAGVYGVSFLVASVSGLLAEFALKRRRWHRSATAIAAMFISALVYGELRIRRTTVHAGPRVAVVQPNEKHYHNEARNRGLFERQLELTRKEIPAGAADLIGWPENAVDAHLNRRPDFQSALSQLAREKRSFVLVGAYTGIPDAVFTSAYLFGPDGSLDRYDKVQMIFWSEVMPLDDFLGRYWPALRDLHHRYTKFVLGYTGHGREAADIKLLSIDTAQGRFRFAVPICFEASGSNFGRIAAQRGADFLINITSEGILGPAMYTHMWALNTFRAVENRLSVVRIGNNGISGFIDPNGRVQKFLRGSRTGALYLEEGTLIDRVQIDERRGTTFYTRFGDLFSFACGAVIAAIVLLGFLRRRISAGRLVTERAA